MNTNLLECLENYKFMKFKVVNGSSKFNETVKQIYVINLYEDVQKRNYIYMLFKKYNINYNLLIFDRPTKELYDKLCKDSKISMSELGCCLSHMWCLLDIIKNNYDNAIIFEDDVILSKNFTGAFLNIYSKVPNLDFLLLGAHDYNFTKKHSSKVINGLYRPNDNIRYLYGAHANYYSLKGAQKMFYIRATNLSFFDNEYNLMFDTLPNSYICYPNLALSNVSESSINHEKPFFSKEENMYYSNCFTTIDISDYNFIYINLLDLSLMKKDDTFETFLDRCLQNKFQDQNKVNIIKKRITMNFFTIDDIKKILSNHSLIVPNNLSKKCIGENS